MKPLSVVKSISAVLAASSLIATPAFATPPQGISVSPVVNGHFGSLSVLPTDKSGKWAMLLKTHDDTDVGADSITLAGGGHTGWHSHPAAVFVTVVRGSIVWYDGGNPVCPGHHYSTGQSFTEDAGVIHNAVNASGSAEAQFIAVRMNPTGVPFVANENKPTNCSQ
jgi:quercetin dioxygenase-like cupin family protein